MAVKQLNDNNFKEAVANNDRLIIKFQADWCGSCRLISPKFKRLSNDERFDEVKFYEIDAERNPEARKWARVSALPFFVTVKNGDIEAADSIAKEEAILELLENVSVA